MPRTGTRGRDAARRVTHFVRGAHRLAISSQSLADLLGLVEADCRGVLEALAEQGMLRKDELDPDFPLYCKE